MMTFEELKAQVEHYDAREDDIRAQIDAATNDRQRWELERLLRVTQVLHSSLIASLERKLARERIGNADHQYLSDEARA
jgi:hypothetical protein